MDASDVPPWLTTTEIVAAVHRQPGREHVAIADWTCHRLTGGGGEGLGVWRVAGQAWADDSLQPWSLILKGSAPPEPGTLPSVRNWPHREMEMYRSGLLTDLPGGIRIPACYGDYQHHDSSVWLWLEDIADGTAGHWPLDAYGRVARHLGQFNGAYLTDRPLPESPCLSRGWLREWVEDAGPAVAELANLADHPLVRQVYPPHVIEAFTRLWTDRHTYYAVLDQMPQVFCHLDVFRRNAFIRPVPDGRDETVLIDWAFAGIAGVGEDLAPLIAASVWLMDVPAEEARSLEAIVLESYIEGLRDTGWHGDRDLVRRGYGIATGLRYGPGGVRILLPILLDERLHPYLEQILGGSMSEITVHLAAVNEWLADLVPEI
jgi:hypothetical protein